MPGEADEGPDDDLFLPVLPADEGLLFPREAEADVLFPDEAEVDLFLLEESDAGGLGFPALLLFMFGIMITPWEFEESPVLPSEF